MDFQVVMAILFEIPVFFGPPCSYYWLVRVRADLDGRAVRGARGAVRGQPLPQLRALPGGGHRRVPLLLRARLPRAQVT